MNLGKQLKEGLLTQNPVLVQMLGLCSTMAITTSSMNGLGMGVSVLIILTAANVVISAIRKIVPDKIRIAMFIVVIAGFVTCVDLLLQAFVPAIAESLGVFIPLIVVNCIILGRAEAYASKSPVLLSALDGVGMGLGFTLGLTCIGIFREILGSGAIFGFEFIPDDFHIAMFVMAPGAFFVLAGLTALQNKLKMPCATNTPEAEEISCTGNCAACAGHVETCGKAPEEAAASREEDEKE